MLRERSFDFDKKIKIPPCASEKDLINYVLVRPIRVSDRSLKVDIGENSNVCVRSYESSARDFQTKNFLFLRV